MGYGQYQLGLLPKRADAQHLYLAKYLNFDALPPIPDAWDGYLNGQARPVLGGNDKYGDCGVVGIVNRLRMGAAVDGRPLPDFTDKEILDYYFTYTGGQDSGVVLSDFLDYVLAKGFPGDGRMKFRARVAIDHTNWDAMRLAASLFGGLYIGVGLPTRCQSEGKHWSVQGDGATGIDALWSWGGHCVVVSGFDSTPSKPFDQPGEPVGNMSILTWAECIYITKHWFSTYVTEAHAILDESHLALPGINADALLADAKQLAA